MQNLGTKKEVTMRKKGDFALRRIGNETVLVATGIKNIDFGNIISMNSTAAMLWEETGDGDFTPATLAALLTDRYDIDAGTALDDAEDICEQWRSAGITED